MEDNKKLGQEPVFPSEFDPQSRSFVTPNPDQFRLDYEKNVCGMSKRFYAACAAMQGLLSNPDWAKTANIPDDFDEYKERVISASFEFADEFLKQENQ